MESIIDTNNLSNEYKKILPNIRMLHVNLDNYKKNGMIMLLKKI